MNAACHTTRSGLEQASIMVSVLPAPVANAGSNTEICYGKNVQLNGTGGISYNWCPQKYLDNPAAGSPVVIKPQETIMYSLFVIDADGCTSLQESKVEVRVTPPVKVFSGNDTSIVMNQPFQLTAVDINNSGINQYVWLPSYGMNNALSQKTVVQLDREMRYTVTATTPAGCEGRDEILLKVYQGPEISGSAATGTQVKANATSIMGQLGSLPGFVSAIQPNGSAPALL